MYFPFLRGRQFELIALREFADVLGDINNVIPIIEPVKDTFNSMRLALPKLIECNVKFALVLNPQVGDIKNTNQIFEGLNGCLGDVSKWIPAFIVTNKYEEISRLIVETTYNDVMVICTELTDTSNESFLKLVTSPEVKYIVSAENKTLKRKLQDTKCLIRLDDNFNGQKRNSDYLEMAEERFSEEHLFYKEDKYYGFSDYTVLVSDFIEGGSAPYAVAIHLTYQKENKEVWIRHFTSTSNYDRANIQGKFAEALEKAVTFIKSKNIQNSATDELLKCFEESKYPGLGTVKKISIKNHLELINRIIE
ncbi:sce7725 family protein [Flavobacterium lacustre]|uniref:sce7725 family protein n=1 Tax=Flavobacterium lacustre TaxID=3016339 RepID=UPI0022B62B5E|nr:sce7725 family protein [Flavobacterium lacustre]